MLKYSQQRIEELHIAQSDDLQERIKGARRKSLASIKNLTI